MRMANAVFAPFVPRPRGIGGAEDREPVIAPDREHEIPGVAIFVWFMKGDEALLVGNLDEIGKLHFALLSRA
jgi:hypothetical protein